MPECPEYMTKRVEFGIEEYKALRAEMLVRIEEARVLERNGIVAVAVTLSFLLRENPSHSERWAWLIPLVLSLLGTNRRRLIGKHYRRLGLYLRECEDAFLNGSPLCGWEHRRLAIKEQEGNDPEWKKQPHSEKFLARVNMLITGEFTIWFVLSLGTAIVAVYKIFQVHVPFLED